MGYYDYDEYYYEPSEFDMMAEETKEILRSSVKKLKTS